MKIKSKMKKNNISLAIAAMFAAASGSVYAQLDISQAPLYLNATVEPNLIMTLDDSGSMRFAYAGDVEANDNVNIFTSNYYNKMAYSPFVKYNIPVRLDDVVYSTSFTNALSNGMDPSRGSDDLSAFGYRPTTDCAPHHTYTGQYCLKKSTVTGLLNVGTFNNEVICDVSLRNNGSQDTMQIRNCETPLQEYGAKSLKKTNSVSVEFIEKTATSAQVFRLSNGGHSDFSSLNNGTSNFNLGSAISANKPLTRATVKWTVVDPVGPLPAYYSLHYTQVSPAMAKPSACTASNKSDADCYINVIVGSDKDQTPGTVEEQKQNFANWFSFYRTRALSAMTVATESINTIQLNKVRFAWQTLNHCTNFGQNCNGYKEDQGLDKDGYKNGRNVGGSVPPTGKAFENRLRPIDGLTAGKTVETHRTEFYNYLSRFFVNGGTPLVGAFHRAGEYLKTTGKNGVYAEDPYIEKGFELGCRRNYHIALTDGLWNDGNTSNFGMGDADSTRINKLPDGNSYIPMSPYKNGTANTNNGRNGSHSNTLADLAFKYWATDLTNLENRVQKETNDPEGTDSQVYWNPKNNPANWQHMTNINIAFALGNSMVDPLWAGSTYAGDYENLRNGTKEWPAVKANDDSTIYDLWHAAINSRGRFFSAEDQSQLKTAFRETFSEILKTVASSAALAANSTSIREGSKVFQARFVTGDWIGQIYSFDILGNGQIKTDHNWEAGVLLNKRDPDTRHIITTGDNGGIPFRWSSLTDDLKLKLNTNAGSVDAQGENRLQWHRGVQTNEGIGSGKLRERNITILPAIVNSSPTIMGMPNAGYRDPSYVKFVSDNRNRDGVIFIGSSGGMLHAFDAKTGEEKFSFVPSKAYDILPFISSNQYTHLYGVDGSPILTDVKDGETWKTMLAGSMGFGGSGVFVLDVTDPSKYSEDNAANIIYSEFTDVSDSNMGLYNGRVNVVKMANGKYAAIFGNGLNSIAADDNVGAGNSSMYILMLDGKRVPTKWNEGVNYFRIDFPNAGNGASGMTNVVTVDSDRDGVVDYLYGSDVKGNIWKADVTSTTSAGWVASNGNLPLFTAKSSAGVSQPIIGGGLEVVNRPEGGMLVLFGTGKYLTDSDIDSKSENSFYAVLDNGTTGTVNRSTLVEQKILTTLTTNGSEWRQTTNNEVDYDEGKRGWFMDLKQTGVDATGERIVYEPVIRGGRVIFNTLMASHDRCTGGGDSWLMELDLFTGSRLDVTPFDVNGDSRFSATDFLNFSGNELTAVSGRKSNIGISPRPSVMIDPTVNNREYKIMSGSTGRTESIRESNDNKLGRLTWKEVQR